MTGERTRATPDLIHGEITGEIVGAFYEVYNELGSGFVESVYLRALEFALIARGIPSEREAPITVVFKGEAVGHFRADLIVDGKVIVEAKAATQIVPIHEVQLVNYLRATGIAVGFVLNFGPRATFRRLVVSPKENRSKDI